MDIYPLILIKSRRFECGHIFAAPITAIGSHVGYQESCGPVNVWGALFLEAYDPELDCVKMLLIYLMAAQSPTRKICRKSEHLSTILDQIRMI